MPPRVERALGKRDRHAAVGAIVRGFDQPPAGRLDEQLDQRTLTVQIERGRLPGDDAVNALQVLAAVQAAVGFAEQDDVAPRGCGTTRPSAADASSMTPTTPMMGVG